MRFGGVLCSEENNDGSGALLIQLRQHLLRVSLYFLRNKVAPFHSVRARAICGCVFLLEPTEPSLGGNSTTQGPWRSTDSHFIWSWRPTSWRRHNSWLRHCCRFHVESSCSMGFLHRKTNLLRCTLNTMSNRDRLLELDWTHNWSCHRICKI